MMRSAAVYTALLMSAFTVADAAPAVATVFYDAHVFTADSAAPYAEAVAIRGDSIIAVGELNAVKGVAGPEARLIDLKGKFLMPGFIDAHAHPISGGMTLVRPNYPDLRDSIPDLVRFVGAQLPMKGNRLGDVLVVYSVDIGFWSHSADIDAVLSGGQFAKQPILLLGSDGHTAWANRLARTRAGITQDYLRGLSASDLRYYGYDKDLKPNGFLVDNGKSKFERTLPPETPESMLPVGRAAVHYMNGQGITGWLDAAVAGDVGGDVPVSATDPGFLPVYADLAKRGELSAHVAAYPVVHPDDGVSQIDVVETFRAQYKDIPNLTLPGLKVFADGVVEIPAHTAALTKPYRDTGKMTPLLFTPAKMNALVTEANRRGLLVHVHAIGDLAVKAALDAFEASRKANPGSTLQNTLTHAQFVDPEDIPRFAQLHVLAALQLDWAIADPSTNEMVKPYIDPGIYAWMYPARSMLEAGTEIAGASDWPVTTANPFEAIYQAETRAGPQGVLNAAQRMPRDAMLYAYTRNAAKVLNQWDHIGSLAPGKLADMILVDRDILTVTAKQVLTAKVVWTMFGGKIVYGAAPQGYTTEP